MSKVSCPDCGRKIYVDKLWLHRKSCGSYEDYPIACDVPRAARYVYIMLIETNGRVLFYVGQTGKLKGRISSHMREAEKLSAPIDGRMERVEYTVLGVLSVQAAPSDKRKASYLERKVFLRMVEKVGQDMVCGGR